MSLDDFRSPPFDTDEHSISQYKLGSKIIPDLKGIHCVHLDWGISVTYVDDSEVEGAVNCCFKLYDGYERGKPFVLVYESSVPAYSIGGLSGTKLIIRHNNAIITEVSIMGTTVGGVLFDIANILGNKALWGMSYKKLYDTKKQYKFKLLSKNGVPCDLLSREILIDR